MAAPEARAIQDGEDSSRSMESEFHIINEPDSSLTSEGGPFTRAYREAAPRETPCSCVAPLAKWCLWVCGVASLVCLLLGRPAPYLLCLAVAVNAPLPSPLGQLPPLPDQLLLVYVWALRAPLCLGSLLWTVRSWQRSPWPGLGLILEGKLDPVWWSGISVCLLFAVWRGLFVATGVAEALPDRSGSGRGMPAPRRPPRPLVGWLHPYFYRCLDQSPGVRVRRVRLGQGAASFVDFWEREEDAENEQVGGGPRDGRPTFFYVHGGGWKGGHARMTPHSPLLQALAALGWQVVSCEYGKRAWPQHIDDCLEALRFVVQLLHQEAAARGRPGVPSICLGGASAGGHLASLLAIRSVREGLCKVDALVMFYPVLDLCDAAHATARSPFPLPPLGLRFRQSFTTWFFERFVLRGRRELLEEADPLRRFDQLMADQEAAAGEASPAARLPRTLIVHGTCDSVVPLEHSRRWIAALRAKDPDPTRHLLLPVPFARHTFEITASFTVEAVLDGVVAWLAGGGGRPPS